MLNLQKRIKNYLEFIPAFHCNLKCKNCSLASPYFKPQFLDFESFKKDCDKLKEFYQIDLARFTGGESTLHPDIVKFISYPKQIGLAFKSCVISNGINLLSASDEFWENVDVINLSIYKGTKIKYDKIINHLETIKQRFPHVKIIEVTDPEIISKLSSYTKDISSKGAEINIVPGMFKKIWKNTPNTDEEAQAVYDTCWMKESAHVVHEGRFHKCGISLIKVKLHEQENISMPFDYLVDSVNLHETDSGEKLDELMNSNKFLNSCKTCNGFNSGIDEPHAQMTEINVRDILFERK